jgi:cytochrome c-type biogenesis protein CcmH
MRGAAASSSPAPQAQAKAEAPQSSPGDPSEPDVSAIKNRFSADQLEMIKGMVGGLAARLADDPSDYDGWMRLGRAYVVLENLTGAKDAYTHAAELKPAEAEPKQRLAEVEARLKAAR